MAAALDQMIRDGLNVKETSLEFDFGGKVTTKPWPPGQKLMDYIKSVSIFFFKPTTKREVRVQSYHMDIVLLCHYQWSITAPFKTEKVMWPVHL